MADLIGKSLGRYHILEQLGEGGMATVYKAYDTRLETDVAVKVIRTENLAPSVLERALKRFEREAKALAKLTHANIVKVLDYGEYEGKPYLVMPFLQGGTLKERLKGKPIPWWDAARLLIPVARALAYAHSERMIHRDIKPSNILTTKTGDPMLTDFGIAKIIDEETTVDLTGTSAAVGTPEYMAPEQVTAKTVDHRVDIYALGVVYYEMITGRKPFQADTPMAVLFKHATEPLPRPSTFVPDLPNEVEKVLIKSLAKNKDERYQSMTEMANALEKLVESTPQKEKSVSRAIPISPIQPEETLATVDQVEETFDTVDQPAEKQDVRLLLKAKQGEKRPKTSWSWVLIIGIFALIIVICIGVGSYVQIQNVQATATQQAFFAQSTAVKQAEQATKQAEQMLATATKQAEQMQKTATAQARSAQQTATAETRKQNLTATAQACASLINNSVKSNWRTYFCDSFDSIANGWEIGNTSGDLLTGVKSIVNGKLVWEITKSEGVVSWDWPSKTGFNITDFFVSVDVRRVSGPKSSACYGLWFRGSGSNFYIFKICDDQTYRVLLSEGEDWKTLIEWTDSSAIKPDQWNRLSVIAEGDSFEFYINDQLVDSLTNSQWASGKVGIMIEMSEGDVATYEFDNFIVVKP